MRMKAFILLALPLLFMAPPLRAEPVAETLVGTWTCSAVEGDSDVAMTLIYRRSGDFLVGEILEDNGAALLDVWLDDGADELVLRRVISYDATVEMEIAEEAPTWMKLEGNMRHKLGTTARVREEIRFTGSEEFRAIWESDSGNGWELILDRTCKRV